MMKNKAIATVQLAISSVDGGILKSLVAAKESQYDRWMAVYDDPDLVWWLSGLAPTHFYLGSEFCEHLLPKPALVVRTMERALSAGYQFVLLTPVASPGVLRDLAQLFPELPDNTEVVINDWGVGHFIRENFPALRPIAGRILCRMLREPRLDSKAREAVGRFDPESWVSMFQYLKFARMEIDVPLGVKREFFNELPMPTGVHVPFTCVAKGRMCKLGSLNNRGVERYAVGRKCKKECLYISSKLERRQGDGWSDLYQMGNTILNRLSMASIEPVRAAVEQGLISRVIAPGEMI